MNAIPRTRPGQRQSGYALIIMVLGLMGVGGIVASGFTQQAKVSVEHERYKHNQRVLEEAKRALLQFAYNNPVLNDTGPGRLPNADVNNDGVADAGNSFGRLPWNDPDLNLSDLRDASGERLWYAVSGTFRPQALAINSFTSGSMTLRDQTGAVLYDGSNPGGDFQYGIAAVIIAPGPEIDRNGAAQDRSITNGVDLAFDDVADTDPAVLAAANYLDLVNGVEDNATYTSGSATDGFILGPVDGQTNDQIIVITAAEVIAMAEKATLQAYREAINDYLANTGGIYPWLFNYQDSDGLDANELSDWFPADFVFANELGNYLTRYGRIPSIFGPYFGTETTNTFDGHLRGELEYDFSTINPVVSTAHGNFTFVSEAITDVFSDTSLTTDIGFVDLDPLPGSRFTATLNSAITGTRELFFWDDHASPSGFRLCAAGADSLSDCHRDAGGNPTPGGAHQYNLRILRVLLSTELPLNAPGPVIELDTDHAVNPPSAPVFTAADGTDHARVEVRYNLLNVLPSSNIPDNIDVSASYWYDGHYLVGDAISYGGGTLNVNNLFVDSSLALNVRYYPVLPAWAFSNGWHDNIRMAYAVHHRPDDTPPCLPGTDCLVLADRPADAQDTVSLLVIGGRDQWNDDGADGLFNDLADVFDPANADDPDVLIDDNFTLYQGNDRILVIE